MLQRPRPMFLTSPSTLRKHTRKSQVLTLTMTTMMCPSLCTRTNFVPPFSPLKLNISVSRCFNLRRNSSSPLIFPKTMSIKSQIIEHVVLFKIKPDADESKINAMINGLNGLSSLDQVIHISAGAVHRTDSSSLAFTHMLHSRYSSKDDLNAYNVHPAYVSVVTEAVKPIVEDVMAVDWIVDEVDGQVALAAGSAMRVKFLKVKEGLGEKVSDELLEVIGGLKDKFPVIDQISFGKNFSPERAKGFLIALLAVVPGVRELDELDSDSEELNSQKEKVGDFVEGVLVFDYVIQP
ncbi:Transcription regulator AsnC-type [Heracleum sosnowskyi]|uniref:Transcription regulator AsnC-type n=1 Tax=Heracleum sosnowskyi TaxID=360622 RepID=A0AAD8I2K7_9APIA|nr:Transcription regulator AsnC-type [Heracleum sosnowskyi]